MKKKPTLYIIIFVVWTLCVVTLCLALAKLLKSSALPSKNGGIIAALLILNTVILAALWLGSVKDLSFSIAYAVRKKKIDREYAKIPEYKPDENAPRVALLYCTCNDFNAKALSACKKQDYPNYYTVILDDSSDPKYIREINKYRATHGGVKIIRRENRTGYKAGNLNNFLKNNADYDYFVVLDSDEVIPPDYLKGVMKYFAYFPSCGAVQAKHVASEGKNVFQKLMGMSVGSNGTTVQVIKNFYGANALIGHGMTVSRECYEKTGGFPLVVAEDISFAVMIKNAGLDIVYAPDVVCTEEFPFSYASLKKRQCKWTQGNLEYMKKFGGEINKSKMSWFEKADLKLSHYSLPVVPVLSFLLTVFTIALGFAGYPVIRYSLAVYSIMILFLCSPLIPDAIVHGKTKNVFLLIPYFLLNVATYASLSPMMLATVAAGIFGKKAKFIVTPKNDEKYGFFRSIAFCADSLIFGTVIAALSLWACGSVLPVVFIVSGCLLSPFVLMLSNVSVCKKSDRKTTDKLHASEKAKKPTVVFDGAVCEPAAPHERPSRTTLPLS